MRIGELVALKYEDISDTKIIIQRSEVNDFEYDKINKKMKYKGKIIVDHAKTNAGTREISLTKGAKQIINLVKQSSVEYGYHTVLIKNCIDIVTESIFQLKVHIKLEKLI